MRDPYIKQSFKAFKAMSCSHHGPSFLDRQGKDNAARETIQHLIKDKVGISQIQEEVEMSHKEKETL